jgi:hypothetical protein
VNRILGPVKAVSVVIQINRGGALFVKQVSFGVTGIKNVLAYAYDVTAGDKHAVACALVDELCNTREDCLSVQVLQEFLRPIWAPLRPVRRPA